MADIADGLFAINVDADDSSASSSPKAETAAGGSRTFQSEADFQAHKAAYRAQHTDGGNYERLLRAVPALRPLAEEHEEREQVRDKDDAASPTAAAPPPTPVTLTKAEVQRLGYAVGELYYDGEYRRAIAACKRVRAVFQVDGKTAESLDRWVRRCEERLDNERIIE